MNDDIRRNTRGKQFIDNRSRLIGKYSEDDMSFTLTLWVHQKHLTTGVFHLRQGCHPKNATEKSRTYLSRLAEAMGVDEPGLMDMVPLHGLPDEHEIGFCNDGDGKYRLFMNGHLEELGAELFDRVVLKFHLTASRVSSVSLELIEAHDKWLNLELEEFFQFADRTSGFEWLKLEFLLDNLLRASRRNVQSELSLDCVTIHFTAPDCRAQFISIEWEWENEDTLRIELIGPSLAVPKLAPIEVKRLVEFGWGVPGLEGNKNFQRRLVNTSTRDIAAFYVRSLRECFDVRPTDPIYIDPIDLLELVVPRTRKTELIEKFMNSGIDVDKDVRITEKWLRARAPKI